MLMIEYIASCEMCNGTSNDEAQEMFRMVVKSFNVISDFVRLNGSEGSSHDFNRSLAGKGFEQFSILSLLVS